MDEKLADQALIELVDQSCEAYEYGLKEENALRVIEAVKDYQAIKPALMVHMRHYQRNEKLVEDDQVLSPAIKKLLLDQIKPLLHRHRCILQSTTS